jgi:hypothetical protein
MDVGLGELDGFEGEAEAHDPLNRQQKHCTCEEIGAMHHDIELITKNNTVPTWSKAVLSPPAGQGPLHPFYH